MSERFDNFYYRSHLEITSQCWINSDYKTPRLIDGGAVFALFSYRNEKFVIFQIRALEAKYGIMQDCISNYSKLSR